MSKLANSPAAYQDVEKAFDVALDRGELVVELPTLGKAYNFKQRANTFRNLLRKKLEEQNEGVPGFQAEIAYDKFEIVFMPPLEDGRGSRKVWFRPRATGVFLDPQTGEPLDV
jgi:hypothetical protein